MGLAESRVKVVKGEKRLSRNQLITEHLPYVKRIVHRIAAHLPSSVETDDLLNAGIIGLIEAAERYDPYRDNKFTTYAMFRIRGAVLSELRSRDFLSRSTRKNVRELEKTYLKLEQKLGREVEDEEVAGELGVSLDKYYEMKAMSSIYFIGFEEIGYLSSREEECLMGYLSSSYNDDALPLSGLKDIQAALGRGIDQLAENERLVVSLYYWDELTMKEVGKVLGITESRVSQIHSRAIIHLRGKLRREEAIAGN